MDIQGNKLTWTVIIIAVVAIMGGLFVKTMPAYADSMQTYINKVIVNFQNDMQLDDDGDFVYIDDPATQTATIRSYHGSSTTPTVPKYHTFGGVAYKTTAIGNNAMQGIDTEDGTGTSPDYASKYKNLTSVTLPDSIVTIGNNAFQYNYLKSINLPSSVKTIGFAAFGSNHLSGTLTIPDSVTTIYGMAFNNNYLTGTLNIPKSVTKIDDMAFRSNMITAVTIHNKKDNVSIGDNVFAKNSWDEDLTITPTFTDD